MKYIKLSNHKWLRESDLLNKGDYLEKVINLALMCFERDPNYFLTTIDVF